MTQSIEKFRPIRQRQPVVDLLAMLFENAGIHVTDTGEEFSCHHHGTHIDFSEHLDTTNIDYVIEVDTEQVDHLVEVVSVNEVDETRRYMILSALFGPATKGSVNPFHCMNRVTRSGTLLSNRFLRRLLRMADLIHVCIKSPVLDEPEIGHTLVFDGNQWSLLSGLQGEPGRVFHLTIDDALDFHAHAFSALKTDSRIGWMIFAHWYLKWRRRVSKPHSNH